ERWPSRGETQSLQHEGHSQHTLPKPVLVLRGLCFLIPHVAVDGRQSFRGEPQTGAGANRVALVAPSRGHVPPGGFGARPWARSSQLGRCRSTCTSLPRREG